jgi:hypothetical protein
MSYALAPAQVPARRASVRVTWQASANGFSQSDLGRGLDAKDGGLLIQGTEQGRGRGQARQGDGGTAEAGRESRVDARMVRGEAARGRQLNLQTVAGLHDFFHGMMVCGAVVVFVRAVLRAVRAAHGCMSGIATSRILQLIGTNTHRAHRGADGGVKHGGGEYRRDNGDEWCACSADPNHWVAELYTFCARRPFPVRIRCMRSKFALVQHSHLAGAL